MYAIRSYYESLGQTILLPSDSYRNCLSFLLHKKLSKSPNEHVITSYSIHYTKLYDSVVLACDESFSFESHAVIDIAIKMLNKIEDIFFILFHSKLKQ